MKNLKLAKGRYVLAVSGGVDSMALLHLLAQKAIVNSQQSTVNSLRKKSKKSTSDYQLKTIDSTNLVELVVAHFNHGIRPDSRQDEKLVAQAVKKYDLPLEVGHGKLGAGASEEVAREARYKFLEAVAKKHKAKGTITAHHQGDLIETAFINILRGTGRTGLSSISNSKIYRPLLATPKKEILAYAKKNKIQWREDSTNNDTRYLRNYIRTYIMPRLTNQKKAEIVKNLDKIAKINNIIDKEIATLSHSKKGKLSRSEFIMLPATVGEELLVYWLKRHQIRDFDRKTIKRLTAVIKTGQAGSKHEVTKGRMLELTPQSAELI